MFLNFILTTITVVSLFFSSSVLAQQFPSRPIHIVVPFSAGGTSDVTARTFAQELSRVSNNPVVVENRPGAFITVGANHVLSLPRDGHTLLLTANGITSNKHFNPNPQNDFSDRFTPVGYLVENAMVLMVSNNTPVSNLQEFVLLIRSRGNDFNYATVGGGGTLQMASLLFFRSTNTKMTDILYSGGSQATTDLLAGRIHMMFDSTIVGLPHYRSGNARVLAVTSSNRSRLAPEIPTLQENGIDVNFSAWQSLFVPVDTPLAIRRQLNEIINKTLADTATVERFNNLGVDRVIGGSLEDITNRYRNEINMWNRVLGNR